jgi:hypothetical protein
MILAPSRPKTPLPDLVPTPQGLRPISERSQSTRIAPKRLRRSLGNHRAGSKSSAPTRKLLLQLLHQGPRKGFRSSDPKGMLIISTFFYHLLLINKLPCRVPQDIPSASPTKNIPTENYSPKVNKPPSPSPGKIIPEMQNLPGSEDINVPTSAASNLASQPAADPSRDATPNKT